MARGAGRSAYIAETIADLASEEIREALTTTRLMRDRIRWYLRRDKSVADKIDKETLQAAREEREPDTDAITRMAIDLKPEELAKLFASYTNGVQKLSNEARKHWADVEEQLKQLSDGELENELILAIRAAVAAMKPSERRAFIANLSAADIEVPKSIQ